MDLYKDINDLVKYGLDGVKSRTRGSDASEALTQAAEAAIRIALVDKRISSK